MRKVSEYLAHAKECQQMAAKMQDPRQRQQLIEMADAWEMLAAERKRQLAKPGIIALADGHDDAAGEGEPPTP